MNPSRILSIKAGFRRTKFKIFSCLRFSFLYLLSSIFCFKKPFLTSSICLLRVSFNLPEIDCRCIFFHLAKAGALGETPRDNLTYAEDPPNVFCLLQAMAVFESLNRIICIIIVTKILTLIVQLDLKYQILKLINKIDSHRLTNLMISNNQLEKLPGILPILICVYDKPMIRMK